MCPTHKFSCPSLLTYYDRLTIWSGCRQDKTWLGIYSADLLYVQPLIIPVLRRTLAIHYFGYLHSILTHLQSLIRTYWTGFDAWNPMKLLKFFECFYNRCNFFLCLLLILPYFSLFWAPIFNFCLVTFWLLSHLFSLSPPSLATNFILIWHYFFLYFPIWTHRRYLLICNL